MSVDREAQTEALMVDVDLRLAEIWTMALDDPALMEDDRLRNVFGAFLRVSYAKGYEDATRDALDGQTALLYQEHGYAAP